MLMWLFGVACGWMFCLWYGAARREGVSEPEEW